MWRTKKQNGYTIIETFIVLGVTGAMFATTVALLSDQTARYQFRSSAYNAQQAVLSSINDVRVGYFDSTVAASSTPGCAQSGTAASGNSNCIYVGKMIEVTTTGQVESTPLYLPDSQNPTTSSPLDEPSKKGVVDLPGYLTYDPASPADGVFYVLFNNYSSNTSGGTQSVGVYSSRTMGTMPASGKTICITTDGRQAKLVIGASGTMTVDLVYGACP